MVAYERHIAKDDRLFVVPVRDLIDILLLSGILVHPLLELGLERVEHLLEEVHGADGAGPGLHLHEFIVHLDLLGSASMNRHHQLVLLHDFLEPVLVKFLILSSIHAHDERAGPLGLKSVDPLSGQTHLQTEIVDVHLVVHAFGPDGDDFERIKFVVVRSLHPEF